MKNRVLGLFIALVALLVIACGGGGGGGSSTGGGVINIVGRVIDVGTTGPVSPAPRITIAGVNATAETSDGSFSLDVTPGATSVVVDATSAGFGSQTFAFPAATAATDLGDLYVGPNSVTLRGTVRDAVSNEVIANAEIAFAGRTGVTDASGQFSIANVAYNNTTQTGFWGIFGRANRTGYFAAEFSALGKVAASGVVTVDDVLLVPQSDDPPGSPFNIQGQVLPAAQGAGAAVQLLQGATVVRNVTADGNGKFFFWVTPGTYTIRATKGSSVAEGNVTLTSQNQVVRRDVTF